MADLKIALVGGGSLTWTPRLVANLLSNPALSGSTVVLYDVNAEPLELTLALSRRYRELAGVPTELSATTDRKEALDGAHAVVVTISTGGLRAMRQDLEVAERFGVLHTVGDTCGPAGISRTLRNVPMFLDLARAMEVHCPDAWMLNCSNPLSALTRVVNRETAIRALGVCHGVPNVAREFQAFLRAERVAYVNTGIDHCAWFTSFVGDGRSLREELEGRGVERWLGMDPAGAEADPEFGSLFRMWNGIRKGMELGVLPAIGDRHLVEFLPGFLDSEKTLARFGLVRTSVGDREDRAREARAHARMLAADPSLVLPETRSDDVAAWIVALHGGEPVEDNVSAPNAGQIPQVPAGTVVETRATLDAAGCHPSVSPMPEAVATIVRPHALRDEMVIDAALHADFDSALAAMATDPLVRPENARKLLAALIAATKEWLPQF